MHSSKNRLQVDSSEEPTSVRYFRETFRFFGRTDLESVFHSIVRFLTRTDCESVLPNINWVVWFMMIDSSKYEIRLFEVLFSVILIFGIDFLNYIVWLLKQSGIGSSRTIGLDSMNNRESVLREQSDLILWIIGNWFFANNRTWFYE